MLELVVEAIWLNVTVPPATATGVTRFRVFVSALVDLSVQVETPDALVAGQVPYTFVVPVSVAVKVGTVPTIALLLASFNVIVTVLEATPFAFTGPLPVIVLFVSEAAVVLNTTVPPVFDTGVAIFRVLVSAFVEESVQVETPEAFVEEQVP